MWRVCIIVFCTSMARCTAVYLLSKLLQEFGHMRFLVLESSGELSFRGSAVVAARHGGETVRKEVGVSRVSVVGVDAA